MEKLHRIEMPSKQVKYDEDDDDGYDDDPFIVFYSWKLVKSRASMKRIVQWLKGPLSESEHSEIVLQSTQLFVSKEEAMQDAGEKGAKRDCTHIVLLYDVAEAPTLFEVLLYLLAVEVNSIVNQLMHLDEPASSKTVDQFLEMAWEYLDANTENLLCWMEAVMKKIHLAATVLMSEGSELSLFDAYDYLDMNEMRECYEVIRDTEKILDTSVPEYMKSLIRKERRHLESSGKWPVFNGKSLKRPAVLSEEVTKRQRTC